MRTLVRALLALLLTLSAIAPGWSHSTHDALAGTTVLLPPQADGPISAASRTEFLEDSGEKLAIDAVRVPPDAQATPYLRVSSHGALTVPLKLWRDDAFAARSRTNYAALFLYYGILVALVLYNLLVFFSLRDPLYLVYVAFGLSVALGEASMDGLANQYLWPGLPAWGDAAFVSVGAVAGIFGAIFTRMFLDTAQHTPLIHKLLLGVTAAFAMCALMPIASYRAAAIAASASGAIFAILAVIAACLCWRRGNAGAKWFLLAFLVMLGGALLLPLRNAGLIPGNIFTAQGLQIGAAIKMLLLSFALAERTTAANVEKKLAQHDALRAKEDQVLSMQVSERVLVQRVTERTEALAIANKALERARSELAQQAYYDSLTQLPNRVVLRERLSAAIGRAAQRGGGFALLWVELDGLNEIGEQHGHEVSDVVLRELAPRMVDAVRASDLVVRFGGNEFVIILENVRAVAVASRIADLLIARLAAPVDLAGLSLAVKVRVGIATYPEHGSDSRTLLAGACQAMQAAKCARDSVWCLATPNPPSRRASDAEARGFSV